MGGITVNNENITTKETIRILGYNYNRTSTHTVHIKQLVHKASFNLTKLHRFRSAPTKIKLQLYKTLIRPLLEYPSIILANTSQYQLNKLQIIQNKALKFIYNTHWTDFTTNAQLHNRANLETISDRLHKLQNKALDKAKQLCDNTQDRDVIYKYSDYTIDIEPYNDPPDTL